MPKPEKTYIEDSILIDCDRLHLRIAEEHSDTGKIFNQVYICTEDLPTLTAYLARVTEWLAEQEKP